jgi:hypothetical protein
VGQFMLLLCFSALVCLDLKHSYLLVCVELYYLLIVCIKFSHSSKIKNIFLCFLESIQMVDEGRPKVSMLMIGLNFPIN